MCFCLSWKSGTADEISWSARFATGIDYSKNKIQQDSGQSTSPMRTAGILYANSLSNPRRCQRWQKGQSTRITHSHSRSWSRRGAKRLQSQAEMRNTHPVVARFNLVLPEGWVAEDSVPVGTWEPGGLIRPVPVGSTSSNSKGFCTAILCEGS